MLLPKSLAVTVNHSKMYIKVKVSAQSSADLHFCVVTFSGCCNEMSCSFFCNVQWERFHMCKDSTSATGMSSMEENAAPIITNPDTCMIKILKNKNNRRQLVQLL